MSREPSEIVTRGRRFKSLKRLSWANLFASIITFGGLIPVITFTYNGIDKYIEVQRITAANAAAVVKNREAIKQEHDERVQAESRMMEFASRMDGKLDTLIRLNGGKP